MSHARFLFGFLRSDLNISLSLVTTVSYKEVSVEEKETAGNAGRPEGRRYAGARRESPLDGFRRKGVDSYEERQMGLCYSKWM
jgi:hypothetical protein